MIEEKQEEGFSYAIQTSRGKGNFFYGSNQLIDYTYTTLVKCVLAILLSMLLRKFSHMHRVPFSILCPQSWKFPRSSLTKKQQQQQQRKHTHTTSSPPSSTNIRASAAQAPPQLLLFVQDDAGVISEQTALILKLRLLALLLLQLLKADAACHAMILNAVSSSCLFPQLSNPQGIGPPFTMRYDRISYLFFVPVVLLKEEEEGEEKSRPRREVGPPIKNFFQGVILGIV